MQQTLVQQNQVIIWTVIIVYMVIITAAGSYYSRYMRTADDYFKGGNLLPWWAAGISMYMANFTAYTFVAIASLVYTDGLVGMLMETGPALCYLIAAVYFAKRWHRLGLTSPPEYMEERFTPSTRKTFSFLGIIKIPFTSGLRLYAMCKFTEALLGLDLVTTIVITGLIVTVYTMLGGLWAVIVTDVVQFVVMALAIVILFVAAVAQIFIESSMTEFIARIPDGLMAVSRPDKGHGLFWLAVVWFSYFLDYNGNWGVIQRMCCTPTEREAKKAAYLAMALSIPHAFLLLGPVFIARVLWGAEIADPNNVAEAEKVYGLIAVKLLPVGLIGVMATAMFSATMDTLSVDWNVRSTSFVNDLYVRFMRPNATDKEQIFVGRAAVAFIGVLAVTVAILVAYNSKGLFALGQYLTLLIALPILLPLVFGLLLHKTSKWAGLIGLATASGFAAFNKWGYTLIGRTEPLAFEWEVAIGCLLSIGVMWFSGFFPRDAAYEKQTEGFWKKLEEPHPLVTSVGLPPALGVIGSFTLLIGGLVILLCLLPQSMLNRTVTLVAGVVLILVGWAMRRATKGSALADAELTASK